MTREAQIFEGVKKLYPTAEVALVEVKKPSRLRKAITIRENGSLIAPNIYLDCVEGMEIGEACKYIQDIYEANRPTQNVDISWFRDWEVVKGKVQMKLLNTEKCREYLADKPNVDFLDLSVVFYVPHDFGRIGRGEIVITNDHARGWGIDKDDLFSAAVINARTMVEDMNDLIPFFPGRKMLIITNEDKWHGAAAWITETERLQRMFGRFFILPSSIHEVICIPAKELDDKEFLDRMVKDINSLELPEQDRLSDHAYYFNGESWEI